MAQQFVDEKIKTNKVMVFSKSYCPFCKMAKDALNETGVKYGLVELDERSIRLLINARIFITYDHCTSMQMTAQLFRTIS